MQYQKLTSQISRLDRTSRTRELNPQETQARRACVEERDQVKRALPSGWGALSHSRPNRTRMRRNEPMVRYAS